MKPACLLVRRNYGSPSYCRTMLQSGRKWRQGRCDWPRSPHGPPTFADGRRRLHRSSWFRHRSTRFIMIAGQTDIRTDRPVTGPDPNRSSALARPNRRDEAASPRMSLFAHSSSCWQACRFEDAPGWRSLLRREQQFLIIALLPSDKHGYRPTLRTVLACRLRPIIQFIGTNSHQV